MPSLPPILYIVVPCYNEEQVLPLTYSLFVEKIRGFVSAGKADVASKVLLVNDGSSDATWDIICSLSQQNPEIEGISLSRNRGHQNALLAGLMEARRHCDITISIDCDGQDDVDAMDEMLDAYAQGCDVVYGVRSNRDSDTAFKRSSAQAFYRLMNRMGVESVYNHADYRLLSAAVLDELAQYKEVNLFLRGMIPLIGFRSTSVYYSRTPRVAGESHYPLHKMVSLALNGITSLSDKPLRIIVVLGLLVLLLSLVGIVWILGVTFAGHTVSGWASLSIIVCFLGGMIMLSLGVIGEYLGKMYLEVKGRPRFAIGATTLDETPAVDGDAQRYARRDR